MRLYNFERAESVGAPALKGPVAAARRFFTRALRTLKVVPSDTWASVAHKKLHHLTAVLCADPDQRPLTAELDRVPDEVLENPGDRAEVAEHEENVVDSDQQAAADTIDDADGTRNVAVVSA